MKYGSKAGVKTLDCDLNFSEKKRSTKIMIMCSMKNLIKKLLIIKVVIIIKKLIVLTDVDGIF